MPRVFVVLNPVAGSADEESLRKIFEKSLSAPDWSYECYQTTGQERLEDVIHAALARDFDLYVAAGGDGTVSGVASGLVHSGKPLGIVPAGTGNALARDLEIPLDVDQAVALLAGQHETRTIDVLKVGERYSVLNVSAGLSARMMRDANHDEKRIAGQFAYLRSGVEKLAGLEKQRFDISIDGRKLEVQAVDVLVLNSSVIGISQARWGSRSNLDDGQVEVLALQPDHPLDLFPYLWQRLQRPSDSGPGAQQWSAQHHVTIRTDPTLPVQADGEIIGETPVEVQIVPRALQVVVADITVEVNK